MSVLSKMPEHAPNAVGSSHFIPAYPIHVQHTALPLSLLVTGVETASSAAGQLRHVLHEAVLDPALRCSAGTLQTCRARPSYTHQRRHLRLSRNTHVHTISSVTTMLLPSAHV
eukprot:TRINITY_DN3199_c0_g2_i1.p1 TRINITY_DN3199_c0_g2~~TRINITY_DN3199_c0_g2_i1.p1  ORF type:complete len:113 (+),score=10.93 TRINITY_DN3199_c0_g2_i1:3-341(+)